MATETSPSYTVPSAHVLMYTANVQMALQKKGGLLTSLLSSGSYIGERVQLVNFIGTIYFEKVDGVNRDVHAQDVQHKQRWLTGTQQVAAVLVNRVDQLKMIYDPTSPYVEAMREGAARAMDQTIMSAFFASARTGESGLTQTAFPATDVVPESNLGCTVAKLRALRKLMKQRHVDLRAVKPYIAYTAVQADDLMNEALVQSIDTNAIKPLVEGEVSSFMGFQFVPYENWGDGTDGQSIPSYLDGSSNVIRECPVWVPEGMHHGTWDGLSIAIQDLPSKVSTTQLKAVFMDGATRLEEGKVFKLECQE